MADMVIIMGSGPGVLNAQHMTRGPDHQIVAINNAWRVRNDWDWLVHPEDFPKDRQPQVLASNQAIIGAKDYVRVQNRYGGFVYAGGTMAFTAAYWALGALKPRVIAMIGCDMIYPQKGPTHFYGTGTADPLRDDVTLRSLEAKSARLWVLAAQAGCAVVNLSDAPCSRLLYPRSGFSQLATTEEEHPKVTKAILKSLIHDAHDFVILDRSRIAVAVIELDSAEDDKREEQARRAGLPIIRVKDPRVSSSEMAKRLSGILK